MTNTKRVLVVERSRSPSKIATIARPDAIMLDLMMPVMDGWTFVARCRNQPWCREVPIVAMSAAHALSAAAERLRHFGVSAVVAKPFDRETLIGIVQACAPGRGT